MMNIHIKANCKKGTKEVTPADFMLEWGKEEITPDTVIKQSANEMKNIFFDMFSNNMSKKRRRKGDPPIKRKK